MKEGTEFLHALQAPTSFHLFINTLYLKILEYFKTLSQFFQYPAWGSDILPQLHTVVFID